MSETQTIATLLERFQAAVAASAPDETLSLMAKAAEVRSSTREDMRDKLSMLIGHNSPAATWLAERFLAWSENIADLPGLQLYDQQVQEARQLGWGPPAELASSLVKDTLDYAVACFESSQARQTIN